MVDEIVGEQVKGKAAPLMGDA